MQILEDIFQALYNFKFVGKALAKRPIGMVAASFAVLVSIYVIIHGMWYASIASGFIDVALDVARPRLPAFSIIGGKLTMQSPEPYILTHEDIYDILGEAALEFDRRRFKGRNEAGIKEGFQARDRYYEPQQTFCLIMDTTGAYKTSVNLDSYRNYVVVTKDSLEIVDRARNMPGNLVPIQEKIPNDIRFSPQNADLLKSPLRKIAITAINLWLIIFTPIRLLIKALIAAFLVWLVLLIAKKEKPFGTIYKICLYALSPIILLAILSRLWLPIHGLILQILYFAYIMLAVSAIPKPQESALQK